MRDHRPFLIFTIGVVIVTLSAMLESYVMSPKVIEGPSQTFVLPSDQVDGEMPPDEQSESVGFEEPEQDVGSKVGSGERSSKWQKVRDDYFAEHPHCEFKGCKSKGPFNVHHVHPFHMRPELELDPNNLITLCREGDNHHLWIGHDGNFKSVNIHVRADCAAGRWPKVGLAMKIAHDAKKARQSSKTTVAP